MGTRLRRAWAACVLLAVMAGTTMGLTQQAWAVGWMPTDSGRSEELLAVSFPDATHGWAVGERGLILTTDDGGVSWRPQASWFEGELTDVFFVDASYGWAVGDETLLFTTDGGRQWWSRPLSGAYEVSSVQFLDRAHGWAVSNTRILSTANGGASWRTRYSSSKYQFSDVTFVDSRRGWAVGGDYDQGAVYATVDGGNTWTRQPTSTREYLTAVDFADARHGWAVGAWGTVLRTVDGGARWTVQKANTAAGLSGVQAVDADSAWVCGSEGTVLKTSDGGATWEPQRLVRQVELEPVDDEWLDEGAVETAPVSQSVEETITQSLNGIACLDARRCWVVGGGGVILSTTDGGEAARFTRVATRLTLSGVSAIRAGQSLKLTARVIPTAGPGKVTISLVRISDSRWWSYYYWWWDSGTRSSFTKSFTLSARGRWRAVAHYSGGIDGGKMYGTATSAAKIITVQ